MGTLVKLTNVGEAPYRAGHDGKHYLIEPNGGYVIIDSLVAKHWLGDWEIQNDEEIPVDEKILEKTRVKKYNTYPNPGYKIVVEPVTTEKKKDPDYSVLETKEVIINKYVIAPGVNEEEFEGLKDLKKDKKPTKKKE